MPRKAKFQKPKGKRFQPVARPVPLVQPAKRLAESLDRKSISDARRLASMLEPMVIEALLDDLEIKSPKLRKMAHEILGKKET